MEERNKLLIIDDNKENIRVLIEILKRDYQLNAITDGFLAVESAKKWRPDVILLDVMMPGISGYDVCMQLRACPATRCTPIIFVTGVSDAEEEISCIKTGALDYITKPINPKLLSAKVKNFVEIKRERELLTILLEAKKNEIDECIGAFLNTLKSSPELSDKLDNRRATRSVEFLRIFVKALISNVRFSELLLADSAASVCAAAACHDVGKSRLPDEIIQKPDKLTPEEFNIVKTHVTAGAALIEPVLAAIGNENFAGIARDIIRYHHERWDGTGYPKGLKGNEIPLCARIMAIIDQYDDLVGGDDRSEPAHHFEAIRTIVSESGKGFDPELVQEFLDVSQEFLGDLQKYARLEKRTANNGA